MSEVNITEAMKLAGIKGRQTIYDAMDRGDLSVKGSKGSQRVDVAELERWVRQKYGRSLKIPGAQTSGDVGSDVLNGHEQTSESPGVMIAENAMLKERIAQLERKYSDEKSALSDQIDFLKERIEKADSKEVHLTALLEDHRKGRSRAETKIDETRDEWERRLRQKEAAFKKVLQKKAVEKKRAVDRAWREGSTIGGLWQRLWSGGRPRNDKIKTAGEGARANSS